MDQEQADDFSDHPPKQNARLSHRAVKAVLASMAAAGLPIRAVEIDANNTVRILTTAVEEVPQDQSALETWRASRARDAVGR
jgi:hypothetical protein